MRSGASPDVSGTIQRARGEMYDRSFSVDIDTLLSHKEKRWGID
jgi:hypothetical protein